MKFAINRLNSRSPETFATTAARAEALGWDIGLKPSNPFYSPDPYICLAMAALQTNRMELGILLDNPVMRHPSVLASSITTVANMAPGRVHLGLGSGDTAVRMNGLTPASVNLMEETLRTVKTLLSGNELETGWLRPVQLAHHTDVPVWVAAQGPRMLRLAGALADGVYLRVGTRAENILASWELVAEGAKQAGRNPDEIKLGLIFHTAFSENADEARIIAKSMAAGYFEYSPVLFRRLNISWEGPDVNELRKEVPPDFHHHPDLIKSGKLVEFLPDEAADAFALHGDWDQIGDQLRGVLNLGLAVDRVLPHPVLPRNQWAEFLEGCATQLISQFR